MMRIKFDKRLIRVFIVGISSFYIINIVSGIVLDQFNHHCSNIAGGCYYEYSGTIAPTVSTLLMLLSIGPSGRVRLYRKVWPIRITRNWLLYAVLLGILLSPVYALRHVPAVGEIVRGLIAIPQSIFEEFIFRGVLFCALRKCHWTINILSVSALFAVIHFPFNYQELLVLFVAGIILWLLRFKSKSVTAPLIVHIIHNLVAFL